MSNTLREDLYPILNRAADVPLGGSLIPLADGILEVFRDAMLKPEVVEAALTTTGPARIDLALVEGLHRLPYESQRRMMLNAIMAALDAVVGNEVTDLEVKAKEEEVFGDVARAGSEDR